MDINYDVMDERKIDYSVLQLIKEHSKKYESAFDKKEFLRGICAFEQKFILLNSSNPYDVLLNLEQLDIKSSKLVLDELDYSDVSKILQLFNMEQKKDFYKHFTNLGLVNKFIIIDRQSEEYIDGLSFNRKVELIDSSKNSTSLATEKVYESIPKEKREQVMDMLTSSNGVSALSSTTAYQAETSNNNEQTSEQETSDESDDQTPQNNENNEENQIQSKKETENKLDTEQFNKIINEFLRQNIDLYKEKYPELKEIDLSSEDIYSLLSPELQLIIKNEFGNQENKQVKEDIKSQVSNEETNAQINSEQTIRKELTQEQYKDYLEKYSIIGNGESSVSIVNNPAIKQSFDRAKVNCETEVIQLLNSQLLSDNLEQNKSKTI